MEGTILQTKELKAITYDTTFIQNACCWEDFYAYIDQNRVIRSFSSISLKNTIFPSPDKKIKGKPTCIDCSPSHKFAAVGYSDGGLQLFDIESNKTSKLLEKPKNNSVLAVSFINDTLLIASYTNHTSILYKISITIGLVTVRDQPLSVFAEDLNQIIVPPIYRQSNDSNSKNTQANIIAPIFADIFLALAEEHLYLAQVQADSSIKILFQLSGQFATSTFALYNQDTLCFAASIDNDMMLYKLVNDNQPELVIQHNFDFKISFIGFITEDIVIVFDSKNKCELLSVQDKTVASIFCPIFGFRISFNYEMLIFSDMKLYLLTLPSFGDQVQTFRETNDINGAIDLCKKALSGNPSATIGLPPNVGQRAILIEQMISGFLSSSCRQRLTDKPEEAKMLADEIITLSKDLNMQDWLAEEGLQIYSEMNMLPLFFTEIINSDPDASFFSYNTNFISSLLALKNPPFDATNFLLKCPTKIVSPVEILKYAQEQNNIDLIKQIYLNRFNDPISICKILANLDKYEELCEIVETHLNGSVVNWLFTHIDNEFVIMSKITKTSHKKSTIVLIEKFINKFNKPFSYEIFLNIIVQILASQRMFDDKLFDHYVFLLLKNNTKLQNDTIKALLPKIFTSTPTQPDNRLELLKFIVNQDVPMKFKESLIGMCEQFGFNDIKRKIEQEAKKYENQIKESLMDKKSDLFDFLNNLIKSDYGAKASIEHSIFEYPDLYVIRDTVKFVEYLLSHMSDQLQPLIKEIKNGDACNIFLFTLYKKNGMNGIKLTNEQSKSFVSYMCQYHPFDVRPYLRDRINQEYIFLLPICEKSKVYDACAVISEAVQNYQQAVQYILKFFALHLVLYVQNETDNHEFLTFVYDFVAGIINKRFQTKESIILSKKIIKCYTLPLYVIQTKGLSSEKKEIVGESLKKMCALLVKNMTFGKLLQLLVSEFQIFDFGLAKDALMTVMNDYAYDVDSSISLSNLYHEDAVNENAKYIKKLNEGISFAPTTCGTCKHRLIGASYDIKIFHCGHVFHNTDQCLPKQICPICNPEESLDQDVSPPTQAMVTSNRVRRELNKFEFMIKSKRFGKDTQLSEIKTGDLTILPRTDMPF